MKKKRLDRLEQSFYTGLSEERMRRDLPMPVPDDLWDGIEPFIAAPPSSRRRSTFKLLLMLVSLLLLSWLFITTSGTENSASLASPDPLIQSRIEQSSTVEADMSSQLFEHLKAGNKTSDKFSSTVANFDQKASSTMSASSLLHQETIGPEMTPKLVERRSSQQVPREVQHFENVAQPEMVATKSTPVPLERPVQREQKSWSFVVGSGTLSSDYFIRGNLALDATTELSLEPAWSMQYFAEVTLAVRSNLMLHAGLQYVPMRTQTIYQFDVPFSSESEFMHDTRFRRVIQHQIPSIHGGFAAESILDRSPDNFLKEGEIIPLQAQVEHRTHLLAVPVHATLTLWRNRNWDIGARFGGSMLLQFSELQSSVASIHSMHEDIAYAGFKVEDLNQQARQSLLFSYQLGAQAQYFPATAKWFLSGAVLYSNAFTPAFAFENVKAYPRSLGMQFGIGLRL